MTITVGIKWKDRRPIHLATRQWNRIGKRIHEKVGELWRDKLLPKHFQPDAYRRYKHQPRTPRYIVAKIRRATSMKASSWLRVLGPIDLVYSGQFFFQATRRKALKVYPSRVTVQVGGPYYVTGANGRGFRPNRRNGSKQPDKIKELKSDTLDDLAEIVELFESELDAELAALPEVDIM